VESFFSSSTYFRLFSEEAIEITVEWNLFGYKCKHCCLYGVTGNPLDEVCATVQWRGATLELSVATGNDYVSITRRCCELSSDGCR
jgi:hypothetical protein